VHELATAIVATRDTRDPAALVAGHGLLFFSP
jgi:hypothetical protein